MVSKLLYGALRRGIALLSVYQLRLAPGVAVSMRYRGNRAHIPLLDREFGAAVRVAIMR